MGDLSPFDFFRQETSNADPIIRGEAMTKVILITALMGPDKARTDMIPYLETKMKDLDQILLVLGTKLGDILPYIGGPDHSHLLIPILEVLCGIEETTIRSASSTSMRKILSPLTQNHRSQSSAYLELFRRLASDESGEIFYSRVSASLIFPDIYRISPEAEKPTLLENYLKLVNDEMTLVREAAAQVILPLASICTPEIVTGKIFEFLKVIVTNEIHTVKLIAVDNLVALAKTFKKMGVLPTLQGELVGMLKSCADDSSWQVRQSIVKDYGDLSVVFADQPDIAQEIFGSCVHMLQDSEPEVRSRSTKAALAFHSSVRTELFISELVPMLSQVLEDPVSNVRKVVAEVIVDIAAKVGPELTSAHLSDMVLKLMADEDSLVRLRVIQKLPLIAEECPGLCNRLTEVLKKAFGDSNWRLRKELVQNMPAVVRHMGREYFTENFLQNFLLAFKDGVEEVRTAAGMAVPPLTASNPEYFLEKIHPTIRSLSGESFLLRLSMLTAVEGLLRVPNLNEQLQFDLLSLLISAARDRVPNVRIRAAQAMGSVSVCVGLEHTRTQLRPLLSELQMDKDKDVQHFASTALRACV